MRKKIALVVITSLLVMVFSSIQPSLADVSEENSTSIGTYQRLGGENDLNENHVAADDEGLVVKGPAFTSTLRLERDFLDSGLGAGWSASRAFVLEDDNVVFQGRTVEFMPLELTREPVFTMGTRDQIEFQDRPMWVSVKQDAHGETITITMEDGDSTGQAVYIGKEWLWERGIHRPVVVHEDGTDLSAEPAPQGDGWLIQVHHFSDISIDPSDEIIFSDQGGLVVPHTGDARWYEEEKRLEIDVGEDCHITQMMNCGSIDHGVYVDKDWLDMRIEHLALENHTWVVEEKNFLGLGSDTYYKVGLTAAQVPTTLVYREFALDGSTFYSRGSSNNLRFTNPLLLAVNVDNQSIHMEYGLKESSTHNVYLNLEFLESLNFTHFNAFNGDQEVITWGFDGQSLSLPVSPTEHDFLFENPGPGGGSNPVPRFLDEVVFELISMDSLCREAMDLPSEAKLVKIDTLTGDNGGGSLVEIYVRHGKFCFAWDFVVPTQTDPKFFLASYGVWSHGFGVSEDYVCGYGTESSEEVKSRKEARICDMSGADLHGFDLLFVGGYVDNTQPGWGNVFQSGMACIGGTASAVAGSPIVGVNAVLGAVAVASCANFGFVLGGQIEYLCCNIGKNLVTMDWTSYDAFSGVIATIDDPNERRATTYQAIQDLMPVRWSDWDGYQVIEWETENVEGAKATYFPDVSDLDPLLLSYTQTEIRFIQKPNEFQNTLQWEARTDDDTFAVIETRVGQDFGIDWATPESDIMASVRVITAASGLNLQFEENLPISAPVGLHVPWIPFSVEDITELDPTQILSMDGWITLFDVKEAGFDVPLAMARAVTSQENFLSNITTVVIEFDEEEALGGPNDPCHSFERVHDGFFDVRSSGISIVTGQERTHVERIVVPICFDPMLLSNVPYEIEIKPDVSK
jgi:hypothetical protein